MANLNKRIHLICNAHIDPVWQWEWEEGAAEAISTFRIAAQFCEEYGDFVFNHNEALLYRWVEEYEPALFEKIQALVKAGKWHIMGGWHLQPDCNMPSGEGFVRQALEGRRYFMEKFGVQPTTAINFDPFGHTRGLVQILAKSGYDSYLFCRPNDEDCPLPADTFQWVGYDGSSIMGQRVSVMYNSWLGRCLEKIGPAVDACPENDFTLCLWGVGNHGGGPSKKDLDMIAVYKGEQAKEGVTVIHSTPEAYFTELKKSGKVLPEHKGDLNAWAVGCYTSQIRIKQKYRELENTYFETEKMCAAAAAQGRMAYPRQELSDALYDLLTTQFHDTLPGTSIQPVEEMAVRTLDHGLEILSRVKARAFFALASGQVPAKADEIPVLVYNPHPYPVEGDFECEFMLWDQNRKPEFSMPVIYQDGKRLACQPEKERSNLPIDWRKRVVFHAKLAPSSMNRFNCKVEILPAKPTPCMKSSTTHYCFENGALQVSINKKTGLVDRYQVNGKDYVKKNAFSLRVIQDNFDPWGMLVNHFRDEIDSFQLLSDEEGSKYCALEQVIPSVRIIEDGDVRTVVEAVFGYHSSRAVVRYHLPKRGTQMDLEVRVNWDEKQKMIKLCIPSALSGCRCLGQVSYGVESLHTDGKENVSQKYLILSDGAHGFSVINNGIYGSSCEGDVLKLTLLRSPAYTAHPIDDRKVMVQDRFSPHMDQGERLYQFQFCAGPAQELEASIPRQAEVFNQKPMALSFFPSGQGTLPQQAVVLTGEEGIEMPAFKQAEAEDGYIIRLFNPAPSRKTACVSVPVLSAEGTFTLGAFEILTLKVQQGSISPCNLMEHDFQ